MKIKTAKTPPSSKELLEVLRKEFLEKYSLNLFGIGREKSIKAAFRLRAFMNYPLKEYL